MKREGGPAKYRVLRAIALACSRGSVPPLDERLKSMVASMVGNLLRGGWPEEEISHVAVELALKYDRFHAHNSLLGLQRVMEISDEGSAFEKHKAQKLADAEPPDPRVAKILGVRGPRPSPGSHRPKGDPCAICEGPFGVHVSFQNIPDLEREAMERLERDRQLRRPMRTIASGLPAALEGEPIANLSKSTQPGELADA